MFFRKSATRAYLGLVALLGGCLAASGCDSERIVRLDPVQGTWLHTDSLGSHFYLRITGTEQVEAWNEDPIAGCFERVVYEVLDVEGDELRLGSAEDTVRVAMRRDDDALVVTVGETDVHYASSSENLEALPVCPPPSVVASCIELPALPLDLEVEGDLSGSDQENRDGTHYDLFRIDVASTARLRVDMSSRELNSHLILFDSAGTFVTRNDDASNRTLDSRIDHDFAPGCWIVMPTSEFPNEFGTYTLELSTP